MRWKSVIPVALVSAVAGCVLAVGIVTAFDLGGGHTTTVIQQAPLRGENSSSSGDGGLTPRDIYKRAAPGVVFIRAQVVEQTHRHSTSASPGSSAARRPARASSSTATARFSRTRTSSPARRRSPSSSPTATSSRPLILGRDE